MKRVLAIAFLAVVTATCGSFEAPEPTPETMDDVIANMVLRGVTVHRLVSGDAGCPSSDLHDNAVHLEVSLGTQSATHEIYLMRWRRAADFVSSQQPFENCVAEYRAVHPERQVSTLELEPWRAYGPGWSPQMGQVLAEALQASGGG